MTKGKTKPGRCPWQASELTRSYSVVQYIHTVCYHAILRKPAPYGYSPSSLAKNGELQCHATANGRFRVSQTFVSLVASRAENQNGHTRVVSGPDWSQTVLVEMSVPMKRGCAGPEPMVFVQVNDGMEETGSPRAWPGAEGDLLARAAKLGIRLRERGASTRGN